MKCSICDERKPRRYCPGLRSEICSPCCGNEREESVPCPFDCVYLREARLHERPLYVDPKDLPNRDIRVSEEFLRDHEELIALAGIAIFEAALSADAAVDFDAREAIESLIRTYRTLQSGLYFDSRPDNAIARAIYDGVQQNFQVTRNRRRDAGEAAFRDADILGVLVFFERVQLNYNNGRRRGRAFLDFLRTGFPQAERSGASGSLIRIP